LSTLKKENVFLILKSTFVYFDFVSKIEMSMRLERRNEEYINI